ALGIPVLTGPDTFNAEDIAEMLADVGAMREVKDSDELATELAKLIADPEARRYAGEQGRKTVQENRGAVDRLLALLDPLVPTG
ncbi:MAG: 3-deoxy-D-manno-octulosonic acid transferase, partial [Gammaproteobacteria bacterium]|nr:3-deoxy-D-manno-octulosonic acid transferase [Gammaproteobacteria bacterium]